MMRIMISLMKSINLTTEEKIDLEALHDTSRDGRVRDRIKAVFSKLVCWVTPQFSPSRFGAHR